MGLLRLNAATNQVRTTSIAALGTASVLAFKMRVNGAYLLSGATAPAIANALYIGSTTSGRLNFVIARDASNAYFVVSISGFSPAAQAAVPLANITSGDQYVVYGHLTASEYRVEIYETDGTLVTSGTVAGAAIPNSGTGNGLVRLGQTANAGCVGDIDGLVIWTTTQAGAARYDTSTDGAVAGWLFNEQSGTSAANIVEDGVALGSDGWSGASLVAGGTWDAEEEPPEIVAGTLSVGTVNPWVVQITGTAASGGVPPYSYQWQRSLRDADDWVNLTGQTGQNLVDRTVTPGADYDYRVEYTDEAEQVAHSNVVQVDVPAAAVVWGALGDSNTDEYRAESNFGGGTPYADTTLNWLELLVQHRSLNFGAWSSTSRGEPRRRGYEYNWARYGATMSSVAGAQLTGLEAQVQAGTVTHCAVQGTVNELINVSPVMLNDVYLSPDGILGVSGTPIATHISNYCTPFKTALTNLLNAGAAGVVAILPPHYLEYEPAASDPLSHVQPNRSYVDAFMEAIYDEINEHCDMLNAQAGLTVAVAVRWDEDFQPIWDTFDGQYVDVGGVAIDAVNQAVNGSPYYRAIDGHTGTVFEGIIANSFIGVANTLAGIDIEPFSIAEILENAGIEPPVDEIIGAAELSAPMTAIAATGAVAIVGAATVAAPMTQLSASGAIAVDGVASITVPSAQINATGSVAIKGQASISTPMTVTSGTGTTRVRGSASITAPMTVISASASPRAQGVASVAAPMTQLSGTGTVRVAGVASIGAPAPQVSAAGDVTISGSASITLPMTRVNASSSPIATGQASLAAPMTDISAAGVVQVRGSGAVAAAMTSLSGSGSVQVRGTASISPPMATIAASGRVQIVGAASVIMPMTRINARQVAPIPAQEAFITLRFTRDVHQTLRFTRDVHITLEI